MNVLKKVCGKKQVPDSCELQYAEVYVHFEWPSAEIRPFPIEDSPRSGGRSDMPGARVLYRSAKVTEDT